MNYPRPRSSSRFREYNQMFQRQSCFDHRDPNHSSFHPREGLQECSQYSDNYSFNSAGYRSYPRYNAFKRNSRQRRRTMNDNSSCNNGGSKSHNPWGRKSFPMNNPFNLNDRFKGTQEDEKDIMSNNMSSSELNNIQEFRSIFNIDKCATGPQTFDESRNAPEGKENLSNEMTAVQNNEVYSGIDTAMNNVCPEKIATFSLNSPDNTLKRFYGDSLLELLMDGANNNNINTKIQLPIVNWSKESQYSEDISKCNGGAVGGDGITIELFYKCTYCKMFTTSSQIELHLRSKYHYDRYTEFLKTESMDDIGSSRPADHYSDSDLKDISISNRAVSDGGSMNPGNSKIDSSDEKVGFDEDMLDYDEDFSD